MIQRRRRDGKLPQFFRCVKGEENLRNIFREIKNTLFLRTGTFKTTSMTITHAFQLPSEVIERSSSSRSTYIESDSDRFPVAAPRQSGQNLIPQQYWANEYSSIIRKTGVCLRPRAFGGVIKQHRDKGTPRNKRTRQTGRLRGA